MNSRRVLPAFIALATGLMVSAQASGQTTPLVVHAPAVPGSAVKDETIKMSDLDLKNQDGAETLLGRIRAASARVCAPRPTAKANFADASDYEKCKATAIERAAKDSGSPMVEAVLKREGG
jgi:UrcA family protein